MRGSRLGRCPRAPGTGFGPIEPRARRRGVHLCEPRLVELGRAAWSKSHHGPRAGACGPADGTGSSRQITASDGGATRGSAASSQNPGGRPLVGALAAHGDDEVRERDARAGRAKPTARPPAPPDRRSLPLGRFDACPRHRSSSGRLGHQDGSDRVRAHHDPRLAANADTRTEQPVLTMASRGPAAQSTHRSSFR